MLQKRIVGIVLLGIVVATAACQSPAATDLAALPEEEAVETTEQLTDQPVSSMANPAAVYCEEHGGTIEIRHSPSGEYGVCLFDDGSECEEWAFYRGECEPGASTAAPVLAHLPSYVNEEYGFSLDSAGDYTIEGWDNHVLFKGHATVLFVGFKWEGEEIEPFRTGMGAGEFQDAGPVTVLDTEIPKEVLVYGGKVKSVSYMPFQVGDLQVFIWLDAEMAEGADYDEADIAAETQDNADQIVASFDLTSGEATKVSLSVGK